MLFLELHVLKVFDLIELKTAMIMYKAHNKYLPVNKNKKMLKMRCGLAYSTQVKI